jgi:hypothetical protein
VMLIDAWLITRASALRKAQVPLETASQAMIRVHKASGQPDTYAADNLVKTSTRALPLPLGPTQKPHMMPTYIRPMLDVSATDKVVHAQLHAS